MPQLVASAVEVIVAVFAPLAGFINENGRNRQPAEETLAITAVAETLL